MSILKEKLRYDRFINNNTFSEGDLMNVKTYLITILLLDSYSLKDKRSVIKSIIAKSHNKYNVSIAEVADNDLHNKGVLGLSIVSKSQCICEQMFQSIIEFIENNYPVEIINIDDYE